MTPATSNIKLGLKENWKQFSMLMLINAFVGGMVGMERTIIPEFAESEFGVSSKTAMLSFIIAFGITKAITNYFTGRLANHMGRKNLLLLGWLIAIPVPFILIYATHWNWVIIANVLLGVSQGLTWSSTVVMKIDLVGEKDRGLAMGLNEFAGYLAVGVVAFFTGYVAQHYGVTPYPFYIGIALSIIGFLVTLIWVNDTRTFAKQESTTSHGVELKNVFIETTFRNKTLSSVTQAGLVNNLNDGMIWGLLPALLLTMNYNHEQIGIITAIYPAVWGISQLFTGKMADVYSKKKLLFWGMLLQGMAIIFLPFADQFVTLVLISVVLGWGTAMVYPTFLTAIAQTTNPIQRAESIGTFRLWRDLGYAIGAILSGIIADQFGIGYAIVAIGVLTLASSMIIKFRMPEQTLPKDECIDRNKVLIALQTTTPPVIIDVRNFEEYNNGHIEQAIHIPLSDLKQSLKSLEPNVTYVVTCGKGGGRSKEGAQLLREHGYNAHWLCGGTFDWLPNPAEV
jgi:predicted MFS family arabinose efflux permease